MWLHFCPILKSKSHSQVSMQTFFGAILRSWPQKEWKNWGDAFTHTFIKACNTSFLSRVIQIVTARPRVPRLPKKSFKKNLHRAQKTWREVRLHNGRQKNMKKLPQFDEEYFALFFIFIRARIFLEIAFIQSSTTPVTKLHWHGRPCSNLFYFYC